MVQKTISTQDIDAKQVQQALEDRSLLQLSPPVGTGQKATWDELTRGLLHKRFDLIVLTVDKNGKRYLRVRGTSTQAKITRQMKVAVMEYVLHPAAKTPEWAQE
ncbi:MAG: hypothetical protein AAF653_10005 [Chloroflexota bacterium]